MLITSKKNFYYFLLFVKAIKIIKKQKFVEMTGIRTRGPRRVMNRFLKTIRF